MGLYGILNVGTKPSGREWVGGGHKKQTPSLVVKQTLAISIFHRRDRSVGRSTGHSHYSKSGAADGSGPPPKWTEFNVPETRLIIAQSACGLGWRVGGLFRCWDVGMGVELGLRQPCR